MRGVGTRSVMVGINAVAERAEMLTRERVYRGACRPSILNCWDQSLGRSARRVRPMPRGRRLSAMAWTKVGARKASETCILGRVDEFDQAKAGGEGDD